MTGFDLHTDFDLTDDELALFRSTGVLVATK